MVYTILASLCTGMAVSCFLILVFDLASMVQLEKQEENVESKRLPVFIRMFLPLAPTLRKLAKSELFDTFRRRTAEMLEMSGFDEAISCEDFVSVRIIMGALGFLFFFLIRHNRFCHPLLSLLI